MAKKPGQKRPLRKAKDSVEEAARAWLIAHFEEYPDTVFYGRQLEVLFEDVFFHWVTNRALRGLVDEGLIRSDARPLSTGSEMKLYWHRNFRFYKRAAEATFKLVDEYSSSASDGALGMQGEHLVLAAFARQKFVLLGEEVNAYGETTWKQSGHDLDFIFERDGIGYGIEVKNILGYMDYQEFLTKIRLARHIGVIPVFAVRWLPKTWIRTLINSGGYAMIMQYQFYPWTHKGLADRIREQLGLPVDTPKRIQDGTMQRLENWIVKPDKIVPSADIDASLVKLQEVAARKQRTRVRDDDDDDEEEEETDEGLDSGSDGEIRVNFSFDSHRLDPEPLRHKTSPHTSINTLRSV